jgi:hypothetical protein
MYRYITFGEGDDPPVPAKLKQRLEQHHAMGRRRTTRVENNGASPPTAPKFLTDPQLRQ